MLTKFKWLKCVTCKPGCKYTHTTHEHTFMQTDTDTQIYAVYGVASVLAFSVSLDFCKWLTTLINALQFGSSPLEILKDKQLHQISSLSVFLTDWKCILIECLLKMSCEEIAWTEQPALCDGRLVCSAKRSDISTQQDVVGELAFSQRLSVKIALI